MICFIDSLWYLWDNTLWGILGVLALICHYWKKVRIFIIPLMILIAYFCIKMAVDSYRESHPPKSKYDDMSVEQLIAETAAREDSIRNLPTFHFVEKFLMEDYGLELSSGSYSEKRDEYYNGYDVFGIAGKDGKLYIFNTAISGPPENMEYSQLWFESEGKNIILNMADGSAPDSRQITKKESLDNILQRAG